MKWQEFILIVARAYLKEFDLYTDDMTDTQTRSTFSKLDDKLASFIASELRQSFDRDEFAEAQVAEAIRLMSRARDDLDAVLGALYDEENRLASKVKVAKETSGT